MLDYYNTYDILWDRAKWILINLLLHPEYQISILESYEINIEKFPSCDIIQQHRFLYGHLKKIGNRLWNSEPMPDKIIKKLNTITKQKLWSYSVNKTPLSHKFCIYGSPNIEGYGNTMEEAFSNIVSKCENSNGCVA